MEGLEPTHLAALDPKSSVSTNFTTPAVLERSAKIGIQIFRWNLQADGIQYFYQEGLESAACARFIWAFNVIIGLWGFASGFHCKVASGSDFKG